MQNEPLALSDVPRIETDEKSANLLALRVIFQRERVSHSQALLELEVFLLANSATFSASLLVYVLSKKYGIWFCDLLYVSVTRVSMPDRAH